MCPGRTLALALPSRLFVAVVRRRGRRRLAAGLLAAGGAVAALRQPVGDAHGQAEEAQAEAVHLGRDGDVGEDGAVAAHQRGAALEVLHHVEDLLPLRLPHHAPHVEQRGHVPLPVEIYI